MTGDDDEPLVPVRDRFGYLLKHARERLASLSAESVERFGINGRELAVLTVIAEGEPPSQLEAAKRLSIDRTTMVMLLDELEMKGFVERRPDPVDRRRNIVVLTTNGRASLIGAAQATDEAEKAFVAPLGKAGGAKLRTMLQAVIEADQPPEPPT